MLIAVLASSFVGARFPRVPTPLVQIATGVALTVLPLDFEMHLEPELFMVLFIAPLLFDDAKRMDKPSLWRFKYPILLLAIGLVLVTVLAIGFAVNLFAPSIPLAAAFALGAALAPTDAVSVGTLKKNAKITSGQSKLLQGESLLNDASSIVSFNFAIAAAITGTFSLLDAEGSFLLKFIGGLALGVVLMLIRYAILRFIRSRGIDSVSFHVLFEVITPLVVYLLAELIGVSGIIAVVAAGIAHSFSPRVVTPTYGRLNVVSTSVWSVIAFTLNGLVFLMLGTQLPYVTARVWTGTAANTNYLLLFIVIILLVSLALRFIWILVMRRNVNLGDNKSDLNVVETTKDARDQVCEDESDLLSVGYAELSIEEREAVIEERVADARQHNREARAARRKERKQFRAADKKAARSDTHYWKLHLFDALVLSLAGVKGAISLAIVLSIPLTLGGSEAFPERDLLIFLTSGVILLSLLVANIVLPIISPKKAKAPYEAEEIAAILTIYRKIISDLDASATPSERSATSEVVQQYYQRISALKKNNGLELPHESTVRSYVIELQLQNTQRLVDEGKVSNFTELLYINSLSHLLAHAQHHTAVGWELRALWNQLKHRFAQRKTARKHIKHDDTQSKRTFRYEMQALQLENYRYVVDLLNNHTPTEEMPAHTVALVRSELEQLLTRLENRLGKGRRSRNIQKRENELIAVEAKALDKERRAISEALANGDITAATAKMMRDNVAIMELDIEDQLE